jgi:hypothetical protein
VGKLQDSNGSSHKQLIRLVLPTPLAPTTMILGASLTEDIDSRFNRKIK